MDLAKEVGRRVKEIRTARGLTQVQLADLVGLEAKTISRIEMGARFPMKENLVKLAVALNCEVKSFFEFRQAKSKAELLNTIKNKLENVKVNDLKYFDKIIDFYFESKCK